MKDILIKGKNIKKEIFYWLIAFAAAVVVNIYSIISYKTAWIELLSQLHIVLALSILFYLVLIAVRGIVRLFHKASKN